MGGTAQLEFKKLKLDGKTEKFADEDSGENPKKM